jgi:hypothetical protein
MRKLPPRRRIVAFPTAAAAIAWLAGSDAAEAARPSLYWHWMTLSLKQSDCGRRAHGSVAIEKLGQIQSMGDDTVWVRSDTLTSTIQCIRLSDRKSLAVIIVTSNSASQAMAVRDLLKRNMASGVLE